MKLLTHLSRAFVGILFIISGLIKANDTIGFSYKLVEYFEIFNFTAFVPFAVPLAMVICIFEIISGFALLLGVYARLNAWLLLLLIVFFTLLTGYSAITNKVTDCGCFGDAIKLTPVQSFEKDLVLLVLILIIFFGVSHIKPLFNKAIVHIGLFTAFLVSTFFTIYTYMFLPVKDFLPYKIGNNIYELTLTPENAEKDIIEMNFIYEKGGKEFEFDMNHLPSEEDGYTYVDRKDKLIKKGYHPPIHDFKIYDSTGVEFTEKFFTDKGYKLVLVQTKLDEGRTSQEKAIQATVDHFVSLKKGNFWALSSSSTDEIKAYKNQHNLNYFHYNMDAIPLKSMVRSNPGLILLKDNVVVKKWSCYNLPSPEVLNKYIN